MSCCDPMNVGLVFGLFVFFLLFQEALLAQKCYALSFTADALCLLLLSYSVPSNRYLLST